MNNKRFRISGQFLVLLVLLGILAAVLLNARTIRDTIRLYGYSPPATIAQIADDTAMTNAARRMFYVNHPVIADRTAFGEHCGNRGEHTIVLGCYHGIDNGIYLFDVTDERLEGVEHVTAAHEMLHAAYDRLSNSERQRIDRLLQDYYDTQVTDERLLETIASYQKSAPKDVLNEMHSIFATEIAVLPPELETYYQRYFTDRSKVVAYAEKYQQEFTARREKVKAFDIQLAALKINMDANTAALGRQEQEIDALRTQMQEYRQSGNIPAYNRSVPQFNAKVDQYNSLIAATKAQIDSYNQIVAERNNLALEVKELAQSINSQLAPIGQ